MAWKFSSNRPIYQQIVDEIELRILNGTYEKGMRLPSVRDLAVEAAVNPNTMQRGACGTGGDGIVNHTEKHRTNGDDGRSGRLPARGTQRRNLLAETFLMQMKALGLSRKEVLERLNKGEHKEGEHAVHS